MERSRDWRTGAIITGIAGIICFIILLGWSLTGPGMGGNNVACSPCSKCDAASS